MFSIWLLGRMKIYVNGGSVFCFNFGNVLFSDFGLGPLYCMYVCTQLTIIVKSVICDISSIEACVTWGGR